MERVQFKELKTVSSDKAAAVLDRFLKGRSEAEGTALFTLGGGSSTGGASGGRPGDLSATTFVALSLVQASIEDEANKARAE